MLNYLRDLYDKYIPRINIDFSYESSSKFFEEIDTNSKCKKKKKYGPYIKLAKFLEKEIKKRNLSKAAFAREIGINQFTIYNYLSGYNFPSKDDIKMKICNFLKIDIKDLESLIKDRWI